MIVTDIKCQLFQSLFQIRKPEVFTYLKLNCRPICTAAQSYRRNCCCIFWGGTLDQIQVGFVEMGGGFFYPVKHVQPEIREKEAGNELI